MQKITEEEIDQYLTNARKEDLPENFYLSFPCKVVNKHLHMSWLYYSTQLISDTTSLHSVYCSIFMAGFQYGRDYESKKMGVDEPEKMFNGGTDASKS
jgi:hypothetical protein